MSNEAPPSAAGAERLTRKLKVVVPAFVSFAETSSIERVRVTEHAVPQFRGVGAPIVKSAELLSVSMEPSPLRRAAELFVVFRVGAVSKSLAAP